MKNHAIVEALALPDTRRRLVRVARKIVATDPDSEDAAHDAIVQALAAADRFRDGSLATTWMHRITVNAALMSLRKGKRASGHLEALAAAPTTQVGVELGSMRKTPEAELEEATERRSLHAAIAALPAPYRAVMDLCVVEERSADEAATALDLTPGAIRTRLGRARAQIGQLLGASTGRQAA